MIELVLTTAYFDAITQCPWAKNTQKFHHTWMIQQPIWLAIKDILGRRWQNSPNCCHLTMPLTSHTHM